MKYILMKSTVVSGVGEVFKIVCESEDMSFIKEKISMLVKDGCPVYKLRIAKDIPYEFKCAIKLDGEVDV